MDWQGVVDRHGAALRRIVSTLVAMFGADAGAALRAPDADPADRPTLARHRHRALMRVLRPAEAAVRRLVIVLALAILAPPGKAAGTDAAADLPQAPQGRPRRDGKRRAAVAPVVVPAGSNRTGIVIRQIPLGHAGFGLAVGPARPGEAAAAALPAWAVPPAPKPPRRLRLLLADPVRRTPKRRSNPRNRPSIWFPGSLGVRPPAWRPPLPHDRIDATRMVLRIEALAAALNDLPGEAKRFLRWRRRRAAEHLRDRQAEALTAGADGPAPGESRWAYIRRKARRFRSLRPLRVARPPGGRRRRNEELRGLRDELQRLALDLLAQHDTS